MLPGDPGAPVQLPVPERLRTERARPADDDRLVCADELRDNISGWRVAEGGGDTEGRRDEVAEMTRTMMIVMMMD